ncbi:DNA mismatch repair protein MutS [Clostridium argentinense CDC 2741]|uniref:DNA mismatch repair protein MutS n=1 Tax=Clostridium argentinense CDC 2741 TaxID=1418104 RepID=A0A0C1ULM8_9CLOT|nr:DNA mismatch repair protein MutS [Clostridium argentinense]ARC85180.1 DNA mismatch repair protein MutS [Clostridium argentinense]KIE48150.1 DNA mismatch repair protein MutS [Clostridium argentinense CDC 2741]NFF39517.1 DNA mismatch repair protein MutS [Clostridium argentinense]NFP50936.1 DNA mismatch repair protein MutS [Clostridium argentinense]NFP73670.1 DNA mismatch repair protein MutS [Clostridium argentinense]
MSFTPMMRQYLEIKDKCKDSILFFRLGDFYEMFFEDAELASKELELTLTGRDCGLENRAPMCGVPFHAAETYISRLVSKGYKVAICEQVEDPAVAKGIVKRDIIKIVTPGTYTESSFLEENKNNFLMGLYISENLSSVCFCDISTGEFYCSDFNYDINIIIDEISKFNPKELVISNMVSEEILKEIRERFEVSISRFDEDFFSTEEEKLQNQFKNYEELQFSESLVRGCNGLLNYIVETQKVTLSNIDTIEIYNIFDYLVIDGNSRRNLEITESLRDKTKRGSLLSVLDKTSTAMGARRLRKWIEQPLVDKAEIELRQNAIEELIKNISLQEDLDDALNDIYDIERLVGKISSKSINAKELLALKNSIEKIPRIKDLLSSFSEDLLIDIEKNLDDLKDIYELLHCSISESPAISVKEGNIIKEGYNEEIDELRNSKKWGKQWIANLESNEKKSTGIKSLKIGYNKVFGYFIEVTKSNLSLIPEGRYIRKQTLSNAERFITPELKEMEDKILGAEDKLISLEYEVFVTIREEVEKHVDRMKTSAKLISELDSLCSLCKVARDNNYIKPSINTKGILKIEDGRHPVVEKMLPINSFVGNDTLLDGKDNQMLLITGPNMAGKSTYMRQVALITLMAQIGSFIPAKSADISVCDKIFTRIGASDDLAGGKSTFMVEMWEVSNILKNATNKSLILLDEVGRGTSTYDGLSIAWAVIEYICKSSNIKCKTLFATHYHELTKLENKINGVKNYSIAVKKVDNNIIFLRKIIPGGADESYGIEVAKLAGIPNKVIDRAREILSHLEDNNNNKDITTIYTENKAVIVEEEDLQEEITNNQVAVDKVSVEKVAKKENKVEALEEMQLGFEDIQSMNLMKEIKNIDILNMTPMEGFNKLYELIKKAKSL